MLTPRIVDGGSAARLLTSIKVELAIVAVILGLVALWRFTPPPRTDLAAAAEPVHVHIHTANAMADVRFESATAGGRTVIVALWDVNFAPLAAKEVTLVLAKPDAGIEPLRIAAVYVADSTWRIDGLSIPMAGRWRVRVEVLVNDFERLSIDDEVDLRR